MAVTATIAVGVRPTGIAAAEGAVWVANSVDGTVSRIDPASNQVVVTIELGEAPQSITVAHEHGLGDGSGGAVPARGAAGRGRG